MHSMKCRPEPEARQARLLILSLLLVSPHFARGEAYVKGSGFRDDFSSYPEGASGAPRWHVLRGDWKIRGGKLVQTAAGEGFAIAAEARERELFLGDPWELLELKLAE